MTSSASPSLSAARPEPNSHHQQAHYGAYYLDPVLLRTNAQSRLRRVSGTGGRAVPSMRDSLVTLRRGNHLKTDLIPENLPRWEIRREVANARSIAVLRDQLARVDGDVGPLALTMESALAIRGIETWLNVPDVHFWPAQPGARTRVKSLPGVVVHGHRVPPSRARCLAGRRLGVGHDVIRGVPVVSIEEAMVDMARYSHPLQAWVGCTLALRVLAPFDNRQPVLSRLRAEQFKTRLLEPLSRYGGRASRRAQAIIRSIDSGSQNGAESSLLWLINTILDSKTRETIQPVPQFSIDTASARYYVDIGFPSVKFGIEMDGLGKLGDGGDTHRLWMQRQHAILAAGWDLARYQHGELADPSALAAKLGDDLRRHGLPVREPAGPLWSEVQPYLLDQERRF